MALKHFPSANVNVIARNYEKIVSLSIDSLRFIDSYQFLPNSLEVLVDTLKKDGKSAFNILNNFYTEEECEVLSRKSCFFYNYVKDISVLDETKLPPIEAFYNTLTDEGISADDYKFAQSLWTMFKMTSLRDFQELYCKTDVILLAEVMTRFRQTIMSNMSIVIFYFYGSPGLSWMSMLRMKKVKIDLLTCPNMLLFCENAIGGGVSLIGQRYARADNKYIDPNRDPNKESSYLLFTDANALYKTVYVTLSRSATLDGLQRRKLKISMSWL